MKLVAAVASLIAAAACGVSAGDPADSWLSYTQYKAPNGQPITYLNATWKVPSMPAKLQGSNAPGWWFGIQTADGDGALIQPILAFADGSPVYTIFNGIYDWNDGSWYQSSASQVKPGQTIQASVALTDKTTQTYTMFIKCVESGWSVTTTKKVKKGQTESAAYFVLEHQPDTCAAYPTDGTMSFTNIYMEVDGKPTLPSWQPEVGVNACDSKATVNSPQEITFTWNTKDTTVVKHQRFHDAPNTKVVDDDVESAVTEAIY